MKSSRPYLRSAITLLALSGALAAGGGNTAPSTNGRTTLQGSVPSWAQANKPSAAVDPSASVGFRVYLGWTDPDGAAALAKAVSDPRSGSYGQYLTPNQFRSRFAPSAADAAKVYPGDYWLSMLAPPPSSAFPRTEQASIRMTDQDHWIDQLKKGCNFCHQLGNTLDTDVTHVWAAKPDLMKTHLDAWEWRLGVGVRGTNMYSTMTGMGKTETLKALADWTQRIANGELPPVPPRPSGIERNIVSTQWDIGDDHSFMHDQISTDKNNPTVNGGGPNYAVNAGHGHAYL